MSPDSSIALLSGQVSTHSTVHFSADGPNCNASTEHFARQFSRTEGDLNAMHHALVQQCFSRSPNRTPNVPLTNCIPSAHPGYEVRLPPIQCQRNEFTCNVPGQLISQQLLSSKMPPLGHQPLPSLCLRFSQILAPSRMTTLVTCGIGFKTVWIISREA